MLFSTVSFHGKLAGALGICYRIRTIQTGKWPVVYTATHMQIGCQKFHIDIWWGLSRTQIDRMHPQATEFWEKWKKTLKQIIKHSPADPV